MFEKSRSPHQFRGVKTARGESDETGTPQSLSSLLEIRFFAAQTYDINGKEEPHIIMMLPDGALYAPPNSVEWSRKLRPLSKWLADAVHKKLAASQPVADSDIPNDDVVDVLGSEG